MKHKAKYIIEEERKLYCPVCKKHVQERDTRLKQMEHWLDHKYFYKAGEYMMKEAMAGRFNEWACMDCERRKKALFPDYSKQNYGIGGPVMFYIPKDMNCDTCKKEFVFEAADQKFWYEDLGFNYSSYPKNCLSCRKDTRTQKMLHKQLADLLHADLKTPEQMEEIAEVYAKLSLNEKAENYLARARNMRK
jgi:hypothetical protein